MIEIYKYEAEDLTNMRFNRWAWYYCNKKCLKRLKKYLLLAHAYTLFDTAKNKPVAILAFHEYGDGMFYGAIIGSDIFGGNPKYAVKMKYLIKCVIRDFKMQYVQTKSEDAPELKRWHEFLGFKPEKKLANHYRGKDFIIWSM